MDDFVKDRLREWQLESLIERFEGENNDNLIYIKSNFPVFYPIPERSLVSDIENKHVSLHLWLRTFRPYDSGGY